MTLPASGNISMLAIRNEFWASESYSSSNTDLMNIGYYRGKFYSTSSGSPATGSFPTPTISFSNFYGKAYFVTPSTGVGVVEVGVGGTCFPAGCLVLMADFTWKEIQLVEVGEMVMSSHGPARVRHLDRTILGTNRSLWRMADDSIQWSSEHSFWVKRNDKQWIWSVDKNQLMWEAEEGMIAGLKDWSTVYEGLHGVEEEFAHLDGWKRSTPIKTNAEDINMPLYLPLTENGELIIVNGYLVGAAINEFKTDYTKLDWNAALEEIRLLRDKPK